MIKPKWWQSAVFYQVYPRSFADGNGDGVGDFIGMTQKIPYLKDLGVDAIWLSPHYPSPNWDWGYDISDYKSIAPEFGSMDDFQEFLSAAHLAGMHVILDLVLNHTSDQHAWFQESRLSRDNPKADWYIWHDPIIKETGGDIHPPNNWQSCFDGPAWTYIADRNQFYYHYFMKQQPDLNWKNPKVRETMWGVVRFWLDLGIDGFRLDAIGTIFEDPLLTPHSVPLDLAGLRYFSNTAKTPGEKLQVAQYWNDMFKYQLGDSGVHSLMKELHSIVDEYPGDKLLVGEDENIEYMGNGKDELDLVFNFPLMKTDRITPSHVRKNQSERLTLLNSLQVKGWGCNTLGNHDCPRSICRYGDGVHDIELAKLNITLLMTLPGTPFIYYGEEIGMSDLIIKDPSILRDTMATWYYTRLVNDKYVDPNVAIKEAGAMSRDKNRTPMQWSGMTHAGFCPLSTLPWLPVNPNYGDGINVEDQMKDPSSLLNYYKRVCWFRRETEALIHGEFSPVHELQDSYLSFMRTTPSQKILVVLNYSDTELYIDFSSIYTKSTPSFFPRETCSTLINGKVDLKPFGICIANVS